MTARGSSVPRLALRPEEAAASLGVSIDHFREKIAPELRCVRQGRVKLYSVRELDKWLDDNQAFALGGL